MAVVNFGDSGARADDAEIRYFANLAGVISPLLEYNPRGEVTAAEAKKINHYQVHYDQDGRLKEIAYFQTQYPSNSSYFRTHAVRYTYDGEIRTRAYFDNAGKPSAKWRHYYQSQNVHREVYETNGDKTVLQLFDVNGEQVSVGTETYRFEGMKIDNRTFLQKHFKKNGEVNTIFPTLLFERVLIAIDENGFLYSVSNWDDATQGIIDDDAMGYAEMRLNFDQYGNEDGWEYRSAAGELVNDPDDGYAKIHYKKEWYDQKQGLYSQYKQESYNSNGLLVCSEVGLCSTIVKRDRPGNIISISYYDSDDKFIVNAELGYAHVEMVINERGQRSEIKYFDENEKLRPTDVAIQRYTYDEQGKLVSEQRLNNELQEILQEK